MSRIFASNSTARRSWESAAAPENTTAQDGGERAHRRGKGDQDRRGRQALHDEAADERDHPDAGVGEKGRALRATGTPGFAAGRTVRSPVHTEQQRNRPSQLTCKSSKSALCTAPIRDALGRFGALNRSRTRAAAPRMATTRRSPGTACPSGAALRCSSRRGARHRPASRAAPGPHSRASRTERWCRR